MTATIQPRETLGRFTTPSNENDRVLERSRRFPSDTVAHIYRPARSAMTPGAAGTKWWRLVFERRSPPFIEPLMGWTCSCDMLTQIELRFPTLDSTVGYA